MAKRKLPEINPNIDETKTKKETKMKPNDGMPVGEDVFIPDHILEELKNVPYMNQDGVVVYPPGYHEEQARLALAEEQAHLARAAMEDPLTEAGLSIEEQIQLLLNPDTAGDLIASFTSNKEFMDNVSHVAKQLKEPLVDILTTLAKDKEVIKLVKDMGLNKLVEKPLTKEDILNIVKGEFATKQDVENMLSNIEVNAEGVVVNNNTSSSSTKSSAGFFKSVKNEIESWFEPDTSVDTFDFKLEKEDLVGSEFMQDLAKRLRDSGVEPKYL